MDVQAGELACRQAQPIGCDSEPSLPLLADVMMTDIGRIADEEGRAGDRRQREAAIVNEVYSQSVCKPMYGGIGTQHQRGERIELDGDELRVGKLASGSDQEPARAGPWIDHASRA
jgi:hypothetical protein